MFKTNKYTLFSICLFCPCHFFYLAIHIIKINSMNFVSTVSLFHQVSKYAKIRGTINPVFYQFSSSLIFQSSSSSFIFSPYSKHLGGRHCINLVQPRQQDNQSYNYIGFEFLIYYNLAQLGFYTPSPYSFIFISLNLSPLSSAHDNNAGQQQEVKDRASFDK